MAKYKVLFNDELEDEVFDTEEEAKQGYIDYKQDYIKNFAKKCKGKVPYKTYEAMMNWVVEITD